MILQKKLIHHPLSISIFVHSFFLLIVIIIAVRPQFQFRKKVDIEVIDYPIAASKPNLQLQPPKDETKPPPPPPQRSVFGVSRKAITASESATDAAEIKQGNTVAKEQDNLQLNKDDADSLPIPADDFLVTQMPKLKSEVRVPYPAEAKKAGVEGPVVMDLLIDDQGKVRKVDLIKGPGFGLNEAAVAAIAQFQFLPAHVGEKSVAVKIRYTYRFILENR